MKVIDLRPKLVCNFGVIKRPKIRRSVFAEFHPSTYIGAMDILAVFTKNRFITINRPDVFLLSPVLNLANLLAKHP